MEVKEAPAPGGGKLCCLCKQRLKFTHRNPPLHALVCGELLCSGCAAQGNTCPQHPSQLPSEKVSMLKPLAARGLLAPGLSVLVEANRICSGVINDDNTELTNKALPHCDICAEADTIRGVQPTSPLPSGSWYCVKCEDYLCDGHVERHAKKHSDHTLVSSGYRKTVESGEIAMYDKCRIHLGSPLVAIDMDSLNGVCTECITPTGKFSLVGVAAKELRQKLLEVLTTPLKLEETKDVPQAETEAKERDVVGLSLQGRLPDQTLLSVLEAMQSIISETRSTIRSLEFLKKMAEDKLALWTGAKYNKDIVARVESGLKNAHNLIVPAINNTQVGMSMVAVGRKDVAETLSGALRLLNIVPQSYPQMNQQIEAKSNDESNKTGADVGMVKSKKNKAELDAEMVQKTLEARPINESAVGEEALALKVTMCLRELIEKQVADGYALPFTMTGDDLAVILSPIKDDIKALTLTLEGYLATIPFVNTPLLPSTIDDTLCHSVDQVNKITQRLTTLLDRLNTSDYWAQASSKRRTQLANGDLAERAIKAVMYDWRHPKPLTLRTLALVEAAVATGNPSALIAKGVVARSYAESLKCYEEAEAKGCTNPVLYLLMAHIHQWTVWMETSKVESDDEKNLALYNKYVGYLNKALSAGLTQAQAGIGMSYGEGCPPTYLRDRQKQIEYLRQLERDGSASGDALNQLAGLHSYEKAKEKFELNKKAAYKGSVSSYYALADAMEPGALVLIDLIEKQAFTDPAPLAALLGGLRDLRYEPGHDLVAGYMHPRNITNKRILRLYFADKLIQLGDPQGWWHKGLVYWNGGDGAREDPREAVRIWEEAERLGLATYQMYYYLGSAYRNGDGVGKDGQVALDYGKKALTVANNRSETIDAYNGMLKVYQMGVPPIPKNPTEEAAIKEKIAALRRS